MEPNYNQIQQLTEALSTLRAMVCDLQGQVQKLKEEWEEEKHLPPYNPLTSKEEGREESFFVLDGRTEKRSRFKKPSVDTVQAFLDEIGETRFTGGDFCNYYEMVGWRVGNSGKTMVNWKSAVRLWQKKHRTTQIPYSNGQRTETTRRESAREREEREDNERRRELLAAVARKLA